MKLIATTSLLLLSASSTFATENVATSDVVDANRKLKQASLMLAHILPSSYSDARNGLFRHGCYCFRRAGGMIGSKNGYNGAPLDALDSLCRDLFRSEKCLQADIENCDNDRAFPYTENDDGSVTCGQDLSQWPNWLDNEANQCKLKLCQLELEFATTLKQMIADGFVADPSISNINNKDYDTMCPPPTPGNPPPELECCGSGINRRPFNAVHQQCCSNEIVSFGSC